MVRHPHGGKPGLHCCDFVLQSAHALDGRGCVPLSEKQIGVLSIKFRTELTVHEVGEEIGQDFRVDAGLLGEKCVGPDRLSD